MRLTIHTFLDPTFHGDDARSASTWAYVEDYQTPVGTRLVVSGSDDRDATVKALNAYWRDQDTKAQAAKLAEQEQSAVASGQVDDFELTFTLPKVTYGEAKVPIGPAPIWTITPSAIDRMLHNASASRTSVEIVYHDKAGNETTRVIQPTAVGPGTVLAYCERAKDVRLFVLSRIQKARRV